MNTQPDLKKSIIAMEIFFVIVYFIVFFSNDKEPLSLIPIAFINIIFILALVVSFKSGKKKYGSAPRITHQDRIMMEELSRTPGFDPKDPKTFPPQYRQRLYELASAHAASKFTPEDMAMIEEIRRTPGFDARDPSTYPPQYRQRLLELTGIEDPQEQYSQDAEPVMEKPSAEPQSSEEKFEYVSENKIEVRCISEVPNTSFALIADGRICGYIGNLPSTFDVPAGMHLTQIITNDVDRKVVFEKNIMFNTKKRFTIKKKLGGYSVSIE